MATYSVRLPDDLDGELNKLAIPGLSRSDIIRNALVQYIKSEKFKRLRSMVMPYAESRGYLTDDDVFKALQ